jgi:hypothetical protein
MIMLNIGCTMKVTSWGVFSNLPKRPQTLCRAWESSVLLARRILRHVPQASVPRIRRLKVRQEDPGQERWLLQPHWKRLPRCGRTSQEFSGYWLGGWQVIPRHLLHCSDIQCHGGPSKFCSCIFRSLYIGVLESMDIHSWSVWFERYYYQSCDRLQWT